MVAALLSTGVAAVFHVLAGGAVPSVLGFLAPAVLATAAGVHLGALPRLRFLSLLAATGAAQVLAHPLFALQPSLGGVGHEHGDTIGAAVLPDTRMAIYHGIAAVVTAAMLHRAEALVALARRTWSTWWRRATPLPATPAAGRVFEPVAAAPARLQPCVQVRITPWRGPPEAAVR